MKSEHMNIANQTCKNIMKIVEEKLLAEQNKKRKKQIKNLNKIKRKDQYNKNSPFSQYLFFVFLIINMWVYVL